MRRTKTDGAVPLPIWRPQRSRRLHAVKGLGLVLRQIIEEHDGIRHLRWSCCRSLRELRQGHFHNARGPRMRFFQGVSFTEGLSIKRCTE
jgi:hypothetical protein